MAFSSASPFTRDEQRVMSFASYEDYLDAHVTEEDLHFLGDVELARMVLENGCTRKDILSRREFDELKIRAKQQHDQFAYRGKKTVRRLAGMGKNLAEYPLLYELARKEKMVRDGRLSTIIFIRDTDRNGHEVSGYIDYGHRLETEDFEEYFLRRKKLLPKPTDLSYYNWDSKVLRYNDSSTFSVKTDERTLLFKHKRDRRTIDVDPNCSTPGLNSTRKPISDPNYEQVVLYGHFPRRRN